MGICQLALEKLVLVDLPGSNQDHVLPILESLIPGYALAMRQALADGDIGDLARMLDLLIAIGPVHIKQYDEDKDASYSADAKENGIEVILLDPRKDSQNTSNSSSRGDNVNDPTPEVGCAFIHDYARGP